LIGVLTVKDWPNARATDERKTTANLMAAGDEELLKMLEIMTRRIWRRS
jgi:hypothetical protein